MKQRWRSVIVWSFFLSAGAVTAYDWSFRVGDLTKQYRLDTHNGILNGRAFAPERYRVLVPYVLEMPIRALTPVFGYDKAFSRSYAAFYWLAIAALFYSLYVYLKEFFSEEQSLVGALFVATTMPIALRYYDYSPYSLLDPTFVAVGLVLMRRRAYASLALLIAVATLNRETAIFIVFYFMATMPRDARHVRVASGYLAIWAAAFWGLRWFFGEARRYFDLETTWHGNTHTTEQLVIAATSWGLLLGAVWLFAVLGYRTAPSFVRRTTLVLPLYLITVLVWGTWIEVRLLLPVYPVVLPLALSYLFVPKPSSLERTTPAP